MSFDFGKYKFTSKYKDTGEKVTFEVRGDAGLDEMLETFERFLRGCGYFFEGSLEVVPQEDHSTCCSEEAYQEAYPDEDPLNIVSDWDAEQASEQVRRSIDDATPEEWSAINRSILNYSHQTDWNGVNPNTPYNITFSEESDK